MFATPQAFICLFVYLLVCFFDMQVLADSLDETEMSLRWSH